MELTILKQVQEFQWNFEQVKQNLQEHIQQYSNLVVNEDNLKDMEKTQKEIASLRTTLGKFRLEVKRQLDKPYQVFEMQVKELAELIESAERPIKDQIDKYETMRREQKAYEVQELINKTAAELGLDEKYSSQIVIADKYLNRTQKWSDTKEDIQMKVAWYLDIQQKDRESETFRQQKIEMAKLMCETLSAGLATPLRFEEIQNRIDSFDIGGLRKHIEDEVASRKQREERAAQIAIEKAEREKREEAERQERARLAEEDRQRKVEEAARKEAEKKPAAPIAPLAPKPLYNAQFVIYGVTEAEIKKVRDWLSCELIEYQHAVKPAEQKRGE